MYRPLPAASSPIVRLSRSALGNMISTIVGPSTAPTTVPAAAKAVTTTMIRLRPARKSPRRPAVASADNFGSSAAWTA